MPFVNPFISEPIAPPVYFEAGSLCREKTKQEMLALDVCVDMNCSCMFVSKQSHVVWSQGTLGEDLKCWGVLLQATCCLQAGRRSWGGLRKQAWLRKQARTVNVVMLAQQDQLCRFVAVHLQLLVEQKPEEKLSVRTMDRFNSEIHTINEF